MILELQQLHKLDSVSRAADYLTERAQYGNSLAKLVVQNFDLLSGMAFLTVPKDVAFSYTDLSWAALGADIEIDATKIFCSLVREYLKKPHRAIIFENQLERPNDPMIRQHPENVAVYGAEVYHVLCSGLKGDLEYPIDKFLEEPRSAESDLGILAEGNHLDVMSRNWKQDDIRFLANCTKAIVVEVFDGEAYLIWVPQSKVS